MIINSDSQELLEHVVIMFSMCWLSFDFYLLSKRTVILIIFTFVSFSFFFG